MLKAAEHTFHIPVLGIGFSVDAPVKVARYGISSVLSIGDDELLEKIRLHYLTQSGITYAPITNKEEDYRARRITAYLDMISTIVCNQFKNLQESDFTAEGEISKYCEMLPDSSIVKMKYKEMLSERDEQIIADTKKWIRNNIKPGSIDVNIMTKLDKANYDSAGNPLPVIYNDAHAAIRGFAKSQLSGTIILSAGMNPKLFSYMETLAEFNPDSETQFNKKIIIKVSDFRSAVIQGKFLSKKGIWVSGYRIESGLNCGGHAFAMEGHLLGPILEEFKNRKDELLQANKDLFIEASEKKNIRVDPDKLDFDVTVQGGIGLSTEQDFLLRYYNVKSVGWGSPFLLVPEVMNVDEFTLNKLSEAGENDIYLSNSSPLGVLYNNLRSSAKESEKNDRIAKGKYGSPCTKNYLRFNTEYSSRPICTASIQFQTKKVKELIEKALPQAEYEKEFEKIVEKECLCEGLTSPALLVNNIDNPKTSMAVSVCPGPNLAYFSKIVSLKEMVDHIYGRINLITSSDRPNMFIKELDLNIKHFKKLLGEATKPFSLQTEKSLKAFRENLVSGIEYYKTLVPRIVEETESAREKIIRDLLTLETKIPSLSYSGIPAQQQM